MTLWLRPFRSSVGKKQLVAVTGLLLCIFLVGHLAGNLLLFLGEEAFDGYANFLMEHPLIIPAEVGLAVLFLAHICLAILVNLENMRARPVRYAVRASRGGKGIANTTMVYSGLLVLIFLIVHIVNFRLAHEEGRSLYWLVIETFHNSLYVIGYVLGVAILGFHVGHGFQSLFRSLGLEHPRYTPWIVRLSILFGVIVAVGFGVMPVYAYLFVELPQ